MKYAGLTDDPERRKKEHGSPSDFKVEREFASEDVARVLEKGMIARGCTGDTGGAGWRYGSTFSKGLTRLRRKSH
jgi:hypothetical protein